MSATEGRRQTLVDLRAFLDSLDEQTRLTGEPALREAVAQQARERLSEMGGPTVDASESK